MSLDPLPCKGSDLTSTHNCGLVTKSCLTLVTPWTIACQAPLSMGFPGKNTGVGCYFLLQGIFLTQGSNRCILYLLSRQADSLPLVPSETASLVSKLNINFHLVVFIQGFPGGSVVKNLPANAGDMGSIPGLRRSLGEGNGNPL